jgi:hypothetical protein
MLYVLSFIVLTDFSIRICSRRRICYCVFVGALLGLLNWLVLLPAAYENSLPKMVAEISGGIWADNFMLAVSLEVLLGLALCVMALRRMQGERVKYAWADYLPPILLLPVLLYIDAAFFYLFPQFDYMVSGVMLFLLVSAALPLPGYAFRRLLDDSYAVIEFRALLNIALFITVLVEPLLQLQPPAYKAPLYLEALGVLIAISAAGVLLGMGTYGVRKSFIKKNTLV